MRLREIPYQSIMQILAVIGLLDSFYLINIYNSPGICKVYDTPFAIPLDCGQVARSSYSEILGIPLAIFGVMFYLSVIVIFSYYQKIMELQLPISPVLLILAYLTAAFLFTIYLLYLQLAVIQAICLYCMVSLVTTTTIFGIYLSKHWNQIFT